MKNDILKAFNELEEEELTFLYSMSVAANKVMNAADVLPNVMKASISNSCGHMTANDGTEYQAKVVLVADKREWRDKDILEVLYPEVEENDNVLNMDDIN